MSEDVFVAQTFEDDQVASASAAAQWIDGISTKAAAEGYKWPRVTHDYGGLLFEAWRKPPKDYGPPRWSFAAEPPA